MFPDDFIPILERDATSRNEFEPKVQVAFGLYPMQDDAKSAELGHPFYVDREFCAIHTGDKLSFYFQPASREDKMRFPEAYRRFKDGIKTPIEGQPLDKWPPISRGEVFTLRAMEVRTVEALANLSDVYLEPLGQRGRDLRTLAISHAAQAKDAAASNKVAAENQALKDQITALQHQMTALAETVSEKKKQKAA